MIGILCKSDMSKYGYLEVFQRVPSTSRYRESTVDVFFFFFFFFFLWKGGGGVIQQQVHIIESTLNHRNSMSC